MGKPENEVAKPQRDNRLELLADVIGRSHRLLRPDRGVPVQLAHLCIGAIGFAPCVADDHDSDLGGPRNLALVAAHVRAVVSQNLVLAPEGVRPVVESEVAGVGVPGDELQGDALAVAGHHDGYAFLEWPWIVAGIRRPVTAVGGSRRFACEHRTEQR